MKKMKLLLKNNFGQTASIDVLVEHGIVIDITCRYDRMMSAASWERWVQKFYEDTSKDFNRADFRDLLDHIEWFNKNDKATYFQVKIYVYDNEGTEISN